MAWSPEFIAALSQRTRAPVFTLERVQLYDEPGVPVTIASHAGYGTDAGTGPYLRIVRVDTQGATLSPRGWTSTIGSFTVTLAGKMAYLFARTVRGTVLQLKMGFAGWPEDEFQVIGLGQVRNVRGRPPEYTLECLDAFSALRQRVTNDLTALKLFDGTGTATTSAAAYAVGDTSLTMSSTTNFKRQTSGTGCVRVTPLSGASPFYLTYTGTGTGPTRITGVSATGKFGTTAVAAASGSTVEEVGYLYGHPLDLARKVLTSRGSGTNGAYDVLPSVWGMGVLHELIDHDDIDAWKEVVKVSSGSYSWDVLVEEAQEDAFGWLESLLSPAGLFLTMRQGLLTIRAGQNSHGASAGVYYRDSGVSIGDDEIAEVTDWEAWDGGHSPEYARIYVQGYGTSTAGTLSATAATLPAGSFLYYDLRDRVYSNVAVVNTEVVNRLDESARNVPERLVLTCAGLRLAQLAPGDLVNVSTGLCPSRWYGTFDATQAIVDEVSPAWTDGRVSVAMLVYPDGDGVYPTADRMFP